MTLSTEQAIVEEQSQRCYGLYDNKARQFRRAWLGVIGLGSIVFGLIFYPYVNFRGDRYQLEATLTKLEQDIGALTRRLAEHGELLDAYRNHAIVASETLQALSFEEAEGVQAAHRRQLAAVHSELGDEPALQPWLRGDAGGKALPAKLRRQHPALASADNDPCFWLSDKQWQRCALAQRIQAVHREISQRFGYKRISHLRNELFVPAHDELEKLHDDFRAWLLADQSAWSFDGRTISGDLEQQFDAFRHAYLHVIDLHERRIHETRVESSNLLWDLQQQRENQQANLQSVVERLREMQNLQSIDTPLGNLPVGLNDFVLLFPALLAAGFWLAASLLADTLQLRGVYHGLCRERDPNRRIFAARHIALVAPTWIDPLQRRSQRVSRWLALLLPAAIFIAAIALLLANRLLWGDFMKEVRLNTAIYSVLYAVSVLLMLEGGRRLWLTLRHYPTKP